MDVDTAPVDNTDPMILEKALKIADHHQEIINGSCTLEDIGCHDVSLSYRLYVLLSETLENMGVNVQHNLTQLLRVLDPQIILPSKLSNFTRKVRRALNKDSTIQNEVIAGIYKPENISEELLQFGVSIDSLRNGQVEKAPPEQMKLMVKHALELRKLAFSRGFNFQKVVDVLKILAPTEQDSQCDVNSVRTQLSCQHRRQQKLLHLCRNEEWESLMTTFYHFPSKMSKNTAIAPETSTTLVESLVARLIACYHQVTTMSSEMTNMAQSAHLQQGVLKNVNTAYHELRTKHNQKLNEIQELKEKLASFTPRNVTKRIKRREEQFHAMKGNVEFQEQLIEKQEKHIEFLNNSLETIKNDKLKLLKSRSYLKNKLKGKATSTEIANDQKSRSYSKKREENAGEESQVISLENEKLELEDKIAELLGEKQLKLMRDGRYNDDVREVYMSLLSMGVPLAKIKEIVRTVLDGIMHVGVDRLPSKTSASMMAIEAQVIAQAQAAEAMLTNANNTFHLDGTRKKFREYGSFQLSTSSKTYSLGISEMLTGNAKSFLDETVNIIDQMSEVVCDEEGQRKTVAAKLLNSITNLMTDRSVVNKKYSNDLEKLRKDVFHLVYSNWDDIPEEEQEKLTAINSLYCGLHVLANMATAAEAGLKEASHHEDGVTAATLLWQCSKALTSCGNQKSGAGEEFRAFLEGKGVKNTIASFFHNRFNILFHDGAAVFYHHHDIKQFLSGACPNNNKLLQSIQINIDHSNILSQCRALGIIDKVLTGPLFRLLEQKDKNIFQLNLQWELLLNYLETNSQNAESLLQGTSAFSEEAASITRDVLYDCLFDFDENLLGKTETKKILEVICTKMAILVKRQLQDQLPGGKFNQPSEELLETTISAPLTNKVSEADFSDLDRMIIRAPQKSTSSKSAAICFTHNKTAKWLKNIPRELKAKYMNRARKLAPKRKIMTYLRMQEIRRQRVALQQARVNKKQLTAENKLKKEKTLKEEIENKSGIMENEESARCNLGKIKSRLNQKKFLKNQILYHKLILHSKISSKSLSQWRSSGKDLTVEELLQNLLRIITDNWPDAAPAQIKYINEQLPVVPPALSDNTDSTHNTNRRKRKRDTIRHRSVKSKKDTLGKLPSIVKSKKDTLGKLPSISELTVGSYVAVAFEGKWFPGQVLNIDQGSAMVDIMYMHPSGKNAFLWPTHEDRAMTESKYIFCNISVISRDSRGRLWTVENRTNVDKSYEQYAGAFFK